MDLTNNRIQNTYGGLLNIGGTGVTGNSLKQVTDGFGINLPIQVSPTTVHFTGNVTGITGAGGLPTKNIYLQGNEFTTVFDPILGADLSIYEWTFQTPFVSPEYSVNVMYAGTLTGGYWYSLSGLNETIFFDDKGVAGIKIVFAGRDLAGDWPDTEIFVTAMATGEA